MPTGSRPTRCPRRYSLHLTVDPDGEGFTGSVTISVELAEATDVIVLHALDLDVHSACIHQAGSAHTPSITVDLEHQWITLATGGYLEAGAAEVQLEYSGRYCENLVGLYVSEFELDGITRRLAVTQCESTHARRFMPCFDEPAFKATFEVTLEVPAGFTAISNSAEVERTVNSPAEGDPGTVTIRFAHDGHVDLPAGRRGRPPGDHRGPRRPGGVRARSRCGWCTRPERAT
ncbi:MAG: hypothetical protein M5U19_02235 [Microthrixaceae bacterium]|nr:hypothetical protein [Microthrixaceae bacterium]